MNNNHRTQRLRENGFLILLLLLFFPVSLIAQEGNPLRIEIEAKVLVDDYFVIPSGDRGLLILFDDEDKGSVDNWTLSNYDTNLMERWSKTIRFDRDYQFLGSDRDAGISHLAFVSRSGTGRYVRIASIDFEQDTLWFIDSELPEFIEAEYLHARNGTAFVLGYLAPKRRAGFLFSRSRDVPVVFMIDAYSGHVKDISPSGLNHHRIVSSSINSKSGNLNILLLDKKRNSSGRLTLHVYAPDGSLLVTAPVASERQKTIMDAKVLQAGEDDIVVLGTYRNSNNRQDDYAEGMFMSLFTGYDQEFIRYYPFIEFSTFASTVSPRTIRKVVKRKSKGKDINVGYRMLIHDEIDIINGEFIIQAEAFHPEYRTEYRYDPFYGYGQTVQVFEGWRFDHALLAGFNRQGDLLWDQTMPMHSILENTTRLREHVLLIEDGRDLILVYTHDGNLYSIVVNDGDLVEGLEKSNIETSRHGDRVRANYRSDLDYWYDSYILVWGYQRIKTVNRKREVFYLNKIVFM